MFNHNEQKHRRCTNIYKEFGQLKLNEPLKDINLTYLYDNIVKYIWILVIKE